MPIHLGTDPRNHTRSLDNFHYPSKDLNNETVLLDGANPEFSFTVRSAGSFDDRPLVDTPYYISSRYILFITLFGIADLTRIARKKFSRF